MEPMASLNDLIFRFPDAGKDGPAALSHVSLSIRPGDFVVLAGLTGSGKTTLLRHLKPETFPPGFRSGSITLFGREPADLIGSTLLSYVPQRPRESLVAGTLRDELDIRLSLARRQKGLRPGPVPDALAISDIVGFLGLSHLLDTPLGNLSEGQAQLVALAASLCARPRLLLLDEPTASLDAVTRRTTIDLLRRLNQDLGMTIVLSEHRLSDLLDIASRLVVVDDGRLLADGFPRRVLGRLWRSGREDLRGLIPQVPQYFLRSGIQLRADGRLPMTVAEGRRALQRLRETDPSQKAAAGVPPRQTGTGTQAKTPDRARTRANMPSSSPSARPLLTVSSVSHTYPRLAHRAVDEVSLEAHAGEILALIGQSGSGKSTLLDLLFGTTRPDFGTISWRIPDVSADGASAGAASSAASSDADGAAEGPRAADGRHPRHRPFFWLSSHTRRRPPRTAQSQISYLPQDPRSVLDLEAGRHPNRLTESTDPLNQSIGQQQLEALEIVLRQDRPVVLLDEPTQGLDALQIRRVGRLITDQARRGHLVILTTHDTAFYARYATRAAVLLAGRLVAQGDPRAIAAAMDYSTTDLHRLLGAEDPGILILADLPAPPSRPHGPDSPSPSDPSDPSGPSASLPHLSAKSDKPERKS